MYSKQRNPWLIEILKDGKWLCAGSSKTKETAEKRGAQDCKRVKGESYRVTER